jgi:hypothetical protein
LASQPPWDQWALIFIISSLLLKTVSVIYTHHANMLLNFWEKEMDCVCVCLGKTGQVILTQWCRFCACISMTLCHPIY